MTLNGLIQVILPRVLLAVHGVFAALKENPHEILITPSTLLMLYSRKIRDIQGDSELERESPMKICSPDMKPSGLESGR